MGIQLESIRSSIGGVRGFPPYWKCLDCCQKNLDVGSNYYYNYILTTWVTKFRHVVLTCNNLNSNLFGQEVGIIS